MPFFAVLVDTQLEPIFGCKSGPPKFSSLLGFEWVWRNSRWFRFRAENLVKGSRIILAKNWVFAILQFCKLLSIGIFATVMIVSQLAERIWQRLDSVSRSSAAYEKGCSVECSSANEKIQLQNWQTANRKHVLDNQRHWSTEYTATGEWHNPSAK